MGDKIRPGDILASVETATADRRGDVGGGLGDWADGRMRVPTQANETWITMWDERVKERAEGRESQFHPICSWIGSHSGS